MEFNREEISLCKQVAERYRKPFKKWDKVLTTNWENMGEHMMVGVSPQKIVLITDVGYDSRTKKLVGLFTEEETLVPKEVIPLWTISDCLEFLKMQEEMNFEALHWLHGNKTFEVELSSSCYIITHYRGKTPLEACLKAVLAVLEERE